MEMENPETWQVEKFVPDMVTVCLVELDRQWVSAGIQHELGEAQRVPGCDLGQQGDHVGEEGHTGGQFPCHSFHLGGEGWAGATEDVRNIPWYVSTSGQPAGSL